MGVVARGSMLDRPWGRTLSYVADRRFDGELVAIADGRRYVIAFHDGAIVAASSPLATDAAVRVALTAGLVTSSQVADISRRVAAQPDLDEVAAVAAAARLGADQTERLRRRVIAYKAIRGFALDRGDFELSDEHVMGWFPEHAIDVRALIYLGARTHMTEQRLLQELARMGPAFKLRDAAIPELPQYGFGEAERSILSALRTRPTAVIDLDGAGGDLDARTTRAVVYALAVTNGLEIADVSVAHDRPNQPTPPTHLRPRPTEPSSVRRPRRASTQPGIEPPSKVRGPRMDPASVPRRDESSGVRAMPTPTGSPTPAAARAATRSLPPRPPGEAPRAQPSRPPATPAPRQTTAAPEPPSRPATDSQGGPRRAAGSDSGFKRAGDSHGGLRARPGGSPPPVVAVDAREHRRPSRRTSMQPSAPAAADVMNLIRERSELLARGADHFALLGITPGTPLPDLRKVYFGLARQLHPDRLTALGIPDDSRDAQRLFAQINTAFAILTTPSRRAEYERTQQRGGEGVVRAEQERANEAARRILAAEEEFRAGEIALRREQLDVALEHFKHALELNPDEADHHAMVGWTIFAGALDKTKVLREARGMLDKAMRMAPKSVAPRLYLGRLARIMGRDREALEHFHEVLNLQPAHTEAGSEIRMLELRIQQQKTQKDTDSKGLFGRSRKPT